MKSSHCQQKIYCTQESRTDPEGIYLRSPPARKRSIAPRKTRQTTRRTAESNRANHYLYLKFKLKEKFAEKGKTTGSDAQIWEQRAAISIKTSGAVKFLPPIMRGESRSRRNEQATAAISEDRDERAERRTASPSPLSLTILGGATIVIRGRFKKDTEWLVSANKLREHVALTNGIAPCHPVPKGPRFVRTTT